MNHKKRDRVGRNDHPKRGVDQGKVPPLLWGRRLEMDSMMKGKDKIEKGTYDP